MDIKTIIEQLRSFSTPELCDGATVLCSMDSSICHRVGASMIVGPKLKGLTKEKMETWKWTVQ